MPTPPATWFKWDTNQVNMLAPIAGLLANGYGASGVPTSENLNQMLNLIEQCFDYLQTIAPLPFINQAQNWTTVTIAGSSVVINDIAYGNGIYCAVGSTTGSPVGTSWTSTDLINWTAHATAFAPFGHVMYDATNGQFVTSTTSAGAGYYSPDGGTTAWTPVAANIGVGYGATTGGSSVWFAENSGTVYYSTNATAWTNNVYFPAGSFPLSIAAGTIASVKTFVVAIGTSVNGQVAYSTNVGLTWTYANLPGSSGGCGQVAFINGKFWALDGSTPNKVYSSADGVTWTLVGTLNAGVTAGVVNTQAPKVLVGFGESMLVIDGKSSGPVILQQSIDAGVTWKSRVGNRQDKGALNSYYDSTNGVFFSARGDTQLEVSRHMMRS